MAKINVNPRISVNKLAEYLEADSTRRRQIIMDAKYPEDFKALRYKDAKDVIFPYLMTHRNKKEISDAIEKLKRKKVKTPWQDQDRNLSIEMLSGLLNIDLSILKDYKLSAFADDNKLIKIKGVGISVYPDIIATKIIKGVTNKGAIKLHYSKTYPLSKDGQSVVAGMLSNYVSAHIVKAGEVTSPKLCVSFDLFNGVLQCCPGSFKVRMTKVEAACEEIALRWPTL